MSEKRSNSSDSEKKTRKKPIKSASNAKPNLNGELMQILAIFKVVKEFPIKPLLLISSIVGGALLSCYFDLIGYQPNLTPVNFSFLIAQALLAGILVAVAFFSLFASTLFASVSTAADSSRKENQSPSGRATTFFLLVLAHFPILLFAYAVSEHAPRLQQLWWIGLAIWALLSCIIAFFRFKVISKAVQPYTPDVIDESPPNSEVNINASGSEVASTDTQASNADKLPPKSKMRSSWMTFTGEMLVHATVALFSAPIILVLITIIRISPASNSHEHFALWLTWTLIAVTSGLCSTGQKTPTRYKVTIMALMVFLILGSLQALNLPVVAMARIAGIGQISGADLTLSDKRCSIIQQQLAAVGMPNRLTCRCENHESDNRLDKKTAPSIGEARTPSVLKNVKLLSRIGTEYYIEISKEPEPLASNNAINENRAQVSHGRKMEQKADEPFKHAGENRLQKEEVVRLIIPKSDADELVSMTRTLSLQEVEQNQKKKEGKT